MNRKRWAPRLLTVVLTMALSHSIFADENNGSNTDRLWNLAIKAYQSHQIESGHIHLNTLIERNPGDVDLAVKCLTRILHEAGLKTAEQLRRNQHLKFIEDHWAEHAAERLCALERIGVVSANSKAVQDAFEVLVEHHARHNRHLQALELIDHYVKKQPHDPFWRIAQARFYRRLQSSKTQSLYGKLKTEMDLRKHAKIT